MLTGALFIGFAIPIVALTRHLGLYDHISTLDNIFELIVLPPLFVCLSGGLAAVVTRVYLRRTGLRAPTPNDVKSRLRIPGAADLDAADAMELRSPRWYAFILACAGIMMGYVVLSPLPLDPPGLKSLVRKPLTVTQILALLEAIR